MAKNYHHFQHEEDFGVSASNLSFVGNADDEDENFRNVEKTSRVDVSVKDQNNNGNNQFLADVERNKSGAIYDQNLKKQENKLGGHHGVSNQSISSSVHWEHEGESLVDLSMTRQLSADSTQVENLVDVSSTSEQSLDRQPLDCSSLDSQLSLALSSKSPIADEVLIPSLVGSESDYDHNTLHSDGSSRFAGDSASSNDDVESDETLVRSLRLRASASSRSDGSIHSSRNRNENNNKKKKLINRDSDDKNSSSKKHEGRARKFPKTRFRSVQLSSLRSQASKSSRKPGAWLSQNVEYGQRLVEKHGESNVFITNTGKLELYSRYASDIFTTLLDSSWWWVLFITTVVYIGHWIIFGFVYLAFAVANNDYAKIKGVVDSDLNQTLADSSVEPCVFEVYDMTTAFLFSMESETTIGYGSRGITTQCPLAVICLAMQCIISAIFDTWVIGMCFARLARPDARARTTMFSKKAVICKRDGKRCLLVRFANLRKSLLVNVTVRARLVTMRAPHAEEKHSGYEKIAEQREVTFHNSSAALLTAPIDYCHVIDKESPLYGTKPEMYDSSYGLDYFELIFFVTGTLESTGLTMHAQTSYLSSEILNGYRFTPVVTKSYEKGKYVVDFKHFHSTFPEAQNSHTSKEIDSFDKAPNRDVSIPLMEETENDSTSVQDDVFVHDNGVTRAESVM